MTKRFLLFLLSGLLLLLLAACAVRASSGDGIYYAVTFYDGDEVLTWKRLEAGSTLRLIPRWDSSREAILAWTDESGQFAEPDGMTVTRSMDFYVYKLPVLTSAGHTDYMDDLTTLWFRPNAALRRGEAARIFCRILRTEDGSVLTRMFYRPEFSDLKNSAEDTAARVLVSWHLMNGYPDGTFRPDEPMTRAEFVSILVSLCPETGTGTDTAFSDVPADHWAAAAIAGACKNGWLTGYDDGLFYPDRPITRAEAVVLLNRAMGYKVDARMLDVAADTDRYIDLDSSFWAFYDIMEAISDSDLLRYIRGEMPGEETGFVFIGEHMGYIDADTMSLTYFEAGFHELPEGLYYAAEDGYFLERYSEGCHELDGSLFYVTEDDGPFLTDALNGYLYFGRDGRYTSGNEELDMYVDMYLDGIAGNDGMSRWEQLYAAYCAIRDGGFNYRQRAGFVRGSNAWTMDCAIIMYEYKSGACFYWASAFLYLARRLGFQAYAVAGGVGTRNQLHAWVMVEWLDGIEYICDVELEWAYARGYYDGVINPTNMFMQSVDASKVIYVFPNSSQSTAYYAEEDDSDYLANISDDEDPVATPTNSPDIPTEPTPTPGGDTEPTPTPGNDPEPTPTPGNDPDPTPTPGSDPDPTPTPGGGPDPTTEPEPVATPVPESEESE